MTEKARIIVCDDEEPMRDMLEELLTDEGYAVTTARDGAELRRLVPLVRPDLVLCDLKMPGEDGLSLTRWLRGESHCAVIMLTGMGSMLDRVVGLEMGADDYLPKPFEPAELRSRIKAVLRRGQEPEELKPATLESGPVRMDVERHVVTVNGDDTRLPLKEFELLEMFLRNPGRVQTRGQLIDRVWGSDYVGDTKTLDVHVKRLRAKLEPDPGDPKYLVTVRGLGYKLDL